MSLVMRSQRAFSEENGRLLQNANVRSCNCCPYGYHIDLDFVRYCESLANAKPSEEELQRRSRRRSRKSMEFMLGLENIFDQWDAAERVQALPEAPHESEPDSPPHRLQPATSTPYHNGNNGQQQRPRSSSVPRFTYGSITRSESPFGTASSTCSSIRGAESDAAATYSRSQQQRANGRTETRAMLREALDDVCSDFERTLERTSMKRKSKLTNGGGGGNGTMAMSFGATTYADRNNNNSSGSGERQKRPNGYSSLSMDKRTCQTWERYFETFDSCVSGNKSPRNSHIYTRSNTLPFQQKLSPAEQQYESYVQATVAANAKSPVEVLERNAPSVEPSNVAPPPPPRRHAHSAKFFSPTTSVTTTDSAMSPASEKAMLSPQPQPQPSIPPPHPDNATADAQTLYNIRQQMALSLKRMKDLEEQVKTIPEMQLQVTQLRNEKQRLEQMLLRKDDELQRTRDLQRHSASSSPSPNASLKNATQFTPQRISPISLESMGSRIRANSTSSERQLKPATVLKRDVGTMCGLYATRDIAVGTAAPTPTRSTGTMPMQAVSLKESIYTELELKQQVQLAVHSYEVQKAAEAKQQERHCVSVGTQMYVVKPDVRDHGIQTSPEKQVLKFSVGVTAQPSTRETFTSCQPDVRSIGCSNDTILDVMCTKCAVPRRTVACGTDEQLVEKPTVSLKLLEMPPRSSTFSLGDNEKLNIKRKTIGTQCSAVALHTTGCQTTMQLVHSIGVQSVPESMAASTQCQPTLSSHRQTDTSDLQRLSATKVVAEEVATPQPPPAAPAKPALPPKPLMRSTSSNTESPAHTLDAAVNTLNNTPAVRHTASNTDQLHKRDVGCGDAVRPHISIACADNYCDSCKDAIKHLAKDFTKQPIASPLPIRAADSKIPRPRHLSSPSPVRKEFKRQNTYTVTPEPSPTSSPEEKSPLSSFTEKPVSSFQQSDMGSSVEQCTTEPTKRSPEVSLDANANETHPASTGAPLTHSAYDDVLLVKEETRVRISWSRDNSPAPLVTSATTAAIRADRESQENQLNDEKLKAALEEEQAKATAEELSQGARRKSTSPAAAAQPAANTTSQEQAAPSQALLQKLAMVEAAPREKVKPPKDMLAALKLINDSLLKKLGAKPFSSASLKNGKATIQQEWFRISSTEQADPHVVEDYLDCFENYSVPLLEYCVNMADTNGNTAMHYAVSHGNFDVVSILLDSKVCNVNQMNNAGYTSVMLVSLAKLKNVAHRTVVERLFQMADVNIRAKKHCQTALMLAVSHGNLDMVEMLLAAGADINIQDEDGSTALMCAAEHGRIDIVKHLLSQPDCDSLIQDIDGSTAFKIAWQAGHRDIGLILYVHEQMLRNKLPNRGEPIDSRTTRTPATLSPKQQHKRQPSK